MILIIFPLNLDALTRPIVVIEDSFLRLRCAASGQPKPHVEWRRLDGRPIADGAWQGMFITIRFHLINKFRYPISFNEFQRHTNR